MSKLIPLLILSVTMILMINVYDHKRQYKDKIANLPTNESFKIIAIMMLIELLVCVAFAFELKLNSI